LTAGVLEVAGLRRSFGAVRALDGVSFSVAGGELFGFLGPNGAGKTTTLRSIMGVTTPDGGSITWHGSPVDAGVRWRFGYMPESRGLYPRMAVRDHLVYLGRLHGLRAGDAAARADAHLEALGLADRARSLVRDLSHGNQQRVQLAAALVHDPELLILDEPFSGLDPVAVQHLMALLRATAAKGTTVVLSSHQLDLVEDLCETAAIIAAGRIVTRGTVRDLKRPTAPGQRVRVAVADDTTDGAWAGRVRGASVEATSDGAVVFHLDPGVDPGRVLRAASRAGTVEEFVLELPHLSDVFHAAVSE
jgi:ABC-2 type transport system ATP-binding protein